MPIAVPVMLTNREMAMGADCGVMRNIAAMKDGREDAYGFDNEEGGWNAHINGACGEVAVAKLLSRFWSPTVNTFHAADIGLTIGVRTRSHHYYDLLHRAVDDVSFAYVLVTGLAPHFIVRGYIIGAQARRDDWVQVYGGRPPAWFVPQEALADIEELKRRNAA